MKNPSPEWVRRLSVASSLPPGIRQGNPDFKKPIGRRTDKSTPRVPRQTITPHAVPLHHVSHPHDAHMERYLLNEEAKQMKNKISKKDISFTNTIQDDKMTQQSMGGKGKKQ